MFKLKIRGIIVITVLLAVLAAGLYLLDRATDAAWQQKFGRHGTATVVAKDGKGTHEPGGDDWKVYYKIDIDSLKSSALPEEVQRAISAAETARADKGDYRVTSKPKSVCDRVHVRDKLALHFRWDGGDRIEILHVGNAGS